MALRLKGASGTLALAVMLACASSQGGGGGAQPMNYKKALGTAPVSAIVRQVPRIFNRYQYEIERHDSTASLVTIYTRWNTRYPLQDEIDAGVTEARTRLTLTARARARAGGTADVRVVELLAENMVLVGDSVAWRQGFMTPMFRGYVDRIADELKTELQTGIRVY